MRLYGTLSFVLLGTACSEYSVTKTTEVNKDEPLDGDPDILVDPEKINFGDLEVGEGATLVETVTISNVSTETEGGTLNIDDLRLADDSMPYEISALGSILLPPGASTTFTVTFSPLSAEEYITSILIDSNDPDEATSEVKLLGQGVAPVIVLDPTTYDFGTIYIGCETPQPITISNAGNADLIVSGFDYVTASNDLGVDDNTTINGPLPWTVLPGESKQVFVDYAPLDDYPDEGHLIVKSNDPIQPEAQAHQTASGELYGENLDVFEQALKSSADLLFVVDNSCSMAEEQANLASNFSSFIETMVETDADWQMAVITTDSPAFRGDIIRPTDTDPEGEFRAQTTLGTGGSGDEQGNEMAYQALQASGDAGPGSEFLRDDARLSIVIVSDEVDSSRSSWVDYVNYYWTLKPDSDMVVQHAIAGDYPSGCATADAGVGYYEVVTATGGLYLSICATDWSSHLISIAEVAAADLSSFELTDFPVPSSIVVTVDGVVQTEGWEYDPVDNAVKFDDDHIPSGGSTIEVQYALYGNCSE